jgi:hypothetical protein
VNRIGIRRRNTEDQDKCAAAGNWDSLLHHFIIRNGNEMGAPKELWMMFQSMFDMRVLASCKDIYSFMVLLYQIDGVS